MNLKTSLQRYSEIRYAPNYFLKNIKKLLRNLNKSDFYARISLIACYLRQY